MVQIINDSPSDDETELMDNPAKAAIKYRKLHPVNDIHSLKHLKHCDMRNGLSETNFFICLSCRFVTGIAASTD